MKTEMTESAPNLSVVSDRMQRTLADRRQLCTMNTVRDVLDKYPALSLDCQVFFATLCIHFSLFESVTQ